jgi:hypothetical protein
VRRPAGQIELGRARHRLGDHPAAAQNLEPRGAAPDGIDYKSIRNAIRRIVGWIVNPN